MHFQRFITSTILLSATAMTLTGCASTATEYVTYLGSNNQSTSVASLQSGDMLGRAIHVNDIVLAARMNADPATPAFANVEEEQD